MARTAEEGEGAPPRCSLKLVHAEMSEWTVILRRGPSQWLRCILWNRRTGAMDDGQWLRGRIAAETASLSPDGERFVFAGLRRGLAYTVVSRPPHLTAIVLWDMPFGMVGGGGRFIGPRHLHAPLAARADVHGRDPELVLAHEWSDARRDEFMTSSGRGPIAAELRPERFRTEAGLLLHVDPSGAERVVRDFTSMRPSRIRAPYRGVRVDLS